MASVVAYDPLDERILHDPYPVLAALRNSTPVFWHDGMRAWLLTRYMDCVAVLRDPGQFVRDRRRLGEPVPETALSVQSLDPPEQALLRSLFMNALHAQNLKAIEADAQVRADWLLGPLVAQDSFDFMREVAQPLAVAVISDLLGIDAPEHQAFAAISDAIMRSMDGGLDPAVAEPGRIAREQLNVLVASWFAASSRDGLLAYVRDNAPDDDALNVFVRNTARVMFQGGYSTMVAALGNAAHTLMCRPEARDALRDPTLLPTAVDELIRYDGPVQGTSRFALDACEIGGTEVRAGDTVTVLFAAANRDPEQFPHPDRLVLDRRPNRHLGFGWGVHSCIGTTAAQAALRALAGVVAARAERLSSAGPPRRRRTATMRAFDVLPATFRS